MLRIITERPSSKIPTILIKEGKLEHEGETVNTGQNPDQVLMFYMNQSTKKYHNFT
jgi:hypothetical protein